MLDWLDATSELTYIEDLRDVKSDIKTLYISGETKNLELLTNFNQVDHLYARVVNQKQFDLLMTEFKFKSLWVYGLRVADLSALESQTELETLVLQWNTKATELWDLSNQSQLKQVVLHDFSKLRSIANLASCTSLEYLDLSGGIWNTLKIETLEPIRSLKNLQELYMSNIRVLDESLEPLTDLESLRTLSISNQFKTEEFAMLSVKLPNVTCDLFVPFVRLEQPFDGKDVMVVGKRKPFLNSVSDQARLRKVEQQFRELQKQFEQ